MINDQEKPTLSSPTCKALLCCPFCGGKVDWCGHDPDEPHSCHQITCNNCGNFDLGRGAPDTIETVEELQVYCLNQFNARAS
jgi:hypothetical protein